MKRSLLVLDTYDIGALQEQTAAAEPWDVLLLGLSEAWFRSLAPRLPRATEHLRYVDPRTLMVDAHDLVRRFVLDVVGTLPNRTIAGRSLWHVFETDLRSSWWYTETSEKGPYRTPLVSQLYQLALIDRAVAAADYQRITVASRSPWLRHAVSALREPPVALVALDQHNRLPEKLSARRRYWRAVIGAVFSVLAVQFTAWFTRWPRIESAHGSPIVFSFYPSWWTGSQTSHATERFFSAPPKTASFLCWFHTPRWLWSTRNEIRALVSVRRLIVLQRYVPWRVLARALSPLRFWRAMRLVGQLNAFGRISFGGLDVGPLVSADLVRSVVGSERFQDELLERAAAACVRARKPSWVLYRAEFQPSEHALVTGVRRYGRSAGFVHYPFGSRYLSIWDPAGERSRAGPDRQAGRARPRPDAMLTCGEIGRIHLIDSGFPGDRVAVCGPQRHPSLVERLHLPRDKQTARRVLGVFDDAAVLLVGTALLEADTEALFGALIEALEHFGPYRLFVRTHPNRPTGDAALRRAIEAVGPTRAAILGADASLYDAIEASDVLITIGSTLAFEAMALGCMPIVFENPSTYAATSLSEFTDALFVVPDGTALRRALHDACAWSATARQKRAHWPDTVRRVLGDVSTPLTDQLRQALDELDTAVENTPVPLATRRHA